MAQHQNRRRAALPLAALLLALSACTPWSGPSPAPTDSKTASPSGQAEHTPPAQGSETPAQSETPAPGETPAQSETPPDSAQSVPPTPSSSTPPDIIFNPVSDKFGLVEEGQSVDEDWFADAVFVGDSRTDGLRLFSGIKGTSFICHTGLSVFTVGTNACIKVDGTNVTAMDALGRQQWAKVYLMLGVNELGYSVESFQQAYTKVVQQVKQLQPNAAVYLQTLIPINESIAYEHGTNRAINNEKLKQFNEVIAGIAQDEKVLLVDVDTPFWSEEGCLAPENTGDGVHPSRVGYVTWYEYLKTHTGTTEPVEEPGQTEEPAGEPTPTEAPASAAPEPGQTEAPAEADPAAQEDPVSM